MLSETGLNTQETLLFQIPYLSDDLFLGIKGGTGIAIINNIPDKQVDLFPLVFDEVTWLCLPTGLS